MIEIVDKYLYLGNGFEIKEFYLEKFGIIRILYLNGGIQSVTHTRERLKYQLCDLYTQFFNIPVNIYPEGKEYLVLGGGGFSYPKYYVSKYPSKKMTVVEKNKECIEIAKKYFYLDDLYKEFDQEKERLKIINDDAIKYINNNEKKYDYILIDLFNGTKVIKEIFATENLNKIKKSLSENGIIIINYIINKYDSSYKEDIDNLKKVLPNYKIITNKNYFDEKEKKGNIIFLSSKNNLKIPEKFEYMVLKNL